MPKKAEADPERLTAREQAERERGASLRRLVAIGGGAYALDAGGRLYRVDQGQETVETPEGPSVRNVALLTPLEVKIADA